MPILEESYLFQKECSEIIASAFAVHNELGKGFLEAVYQEALAIEFSEKNIPFLKEEKINVFYKNQKLTKYYLADFVCYNEILIEIKALDAISSDNISQMLNYIKATGFDLGLIINFGASKVQIKRIIK